MEQKKTLWIIAASGVFLLVVLGAALLLNSSPQNVPATASITTIEKNVAGVSPSVEPISTPVSQQKLDEATLAYQNIEEGYSTENTIEQGVRNVEPMPAPVERSPTTNIELKTERRASSENLTAMSRAGAEELSKTNSTYVVSETKTEKSSNKKSSPSKSKPESSEPLSTKYWVQAASFTNKKSADSARASLDSNKIPAEVFTYKDNKNTLFYRVRVGPYTTKSEAEYWKGRIVQIDMFKETQSYVTQVKM